jgi:hypothetical protein
VHHCEVDIVVALLCGLVRRKDCEVAVVWWGIEYYELLLLWIPELLWLWIVSSAVSSIVCQCKLKMWWKTVFSETVRRIARRKRFSLSKNVLGDVLLWFYVSRRIHSAKMSNGACTWCFHLSTMTLRTSFYVDTLYLDHLYSVRPANSKNVSVVSILAL